MKRALDVTLERLGLVLIGASEFIYSPSRNNPAFQTSAREIAAILKLATQSTFRKDAIERNRFNSCDTKYEISRQISDFLTRNPDISDIIFYYCGHGVVVDGQLGLMLKTTQNPTYSNLLMPEDISEIFSAHRHKLRIYMILDCCFSGLAAQYFAGKSPGAGIVVATSASADAIAIAPPGAPMTLFSGGLHHVLSALAVSDNPLPVSLRGIMAQTRARILEEYSSEPAGGRLPLSLPEIHSPHQAQGDIGDLPIFHGKVNLEPREAIGNAEAAGVNPTLSVSSALRPPIFSVMRRLSMWRATVGVIVLLLLLGLSVPVFLYSDYLRATRYPCDSGKIADFDTGFRSAARSCLGTEWSLIADSAQNMRSIIYYQRMDGLDEPKTGSGFLRIFFQLDGQEGRQPYVGVYTDLSYPPPTPRDLSQFQAVSGRVRVSQSNGASPLIVRVVLYSVNVKNVFYAFPGYDIPHHALTENWVPFKARFSEFKRPSYYSGPVELDPSKIFRIGLLIIGPVGEKTFGHVDVDDLLFE